MVEIGEVEIGVRVEIGVKDVGGLVEIGVRVLLSSSRLFEVIALLKV